MAHVQLTDAIIPEVYLSYQTNDDPELTAFFQSGAAVRSAMLDQAANSGGSIVHVPFWNDIDPNDEPNYSDDTTNVATPDKIIAGEQIARVGYLNKGMSAADLVSELAGSDPMVRIRNRFGTYWTRQWQRRVVASLVGVLADNVANDASDMVEDISIADGNAATDANLWSRSAFTNAAFTLGDRFEETNSIAVHSMVYKRMVDNDDIEFIQDSKTSLLIPTFMGRRVIVDDGMPVVPGATSGFVYTSVLFQNGAIGFGSGSPRVPVEVERFAGAGNGGGIETLWERKTWLAHPFGYKFTSTTVTGGAATVTTGRTATLANLRLAVNWDRVVQRKNVPLAFLKTNG
jgi:hypothetical protein